jgi:hypothetical protein
MYTCALYLFRAHDLRADPDFGATIDALAAMEPVYVKTEDATTTRFDLEKALEAIGVKRSTASGEIVVQVDEYRVLREPVPLRVILASRVCVNAEVLLRLDLCEHDVSRRGAVRPLDVGAVAVRGRQKRANLFKDVRRDVGIDDLSVYKVGVCERPHGTLRACFDIVAEMFELVGRECIIDRENFEGDVGMLFQHHSPPKKI